MSWVVAFTSAGSDVAGTSCRHSSDRGIVVLDRSCGTGLASKLGIADPLVNHLAV
jgi:hypothetical protein